MRTSKPASGGSRALLASVLLLFLPGCTHLFNPYITPSALQAETDKTRADTPVSDLRRARNEAELYAAELEKAAGSHSLLKTGGAAIAIPATGVAAYKGIVSDGAGTKKLITKVTVGVATLFGLQELLYSAPRAAIYLEGATAARCLIGTTDPYLVDDTSYTTFKSSLDELSRQIAKARGALRRLDLAYARVKGAKTIDQEIGTFRAAAEKSITDAEAILAEGDKLRAQMDLSGADLRRRISVLAGDVNKQVQKTEPDLTSIRSIVSTIADSVKTPPSGTGGTAAPAKKADTSGVQHSDSKVVDELRAAVDELSDTLTPMVAAANQVARQVSVSSALSSQATKLSECRLAEVNAFTVEPSENQQAVEIPSTTRFAVYGGTGRIGGTIVGSTQGDKVVAKAQMDDSFYGVVLEVKDGAVPGKVNLRIYDSTRSTPKRIEVELKKKAGTEKGAADAKTAETPAPVTPPAAAAPAAQTTAVVDDVKDQKRIKTIQAGVGLTGKELTGVADQKTREAVRKYKQEHQFEKVDGALTTKLLQEVCAAGTKSRTIAPGDPAYGDKGKSAAPITMTMVPEGCPT